jgi:hypothetical protein
VIGDAEKIRESLRKYGAIADLKLTAPDFAP